MQDETNRDALMQSLGISSDRLYVGKQIHSTNIQIITFGDEYAGANTDGLLYKKEDEHECVVLGAFAADCVPMLFFDEKQQIIGAAHAGWTGVWHHMAKRMIERMIEMGSSAHDIHIIIGPHIGKCCYTVDDARIKKFSIAFGPSSVTEKTLNLSVAIRTDARRMGILEEHIDENEALCTSCNDSEFYSYRKLTKETFGEMMAFIGFK